MAGARDHRWQIPFCLSLANLCLLKEWAFLTWALDAVYPRYPLRFADAALFSVALLVLACFFSIALRFSQGRPRVHRGVTLLCVALFAIQLNFLRVETNFSVHFPLFSASFFTHHLGKEASWVLAIVLVLGFLWAWKKHHAFLVGAFNALVVCCLPFLVLSFGRVAWFAFEHRQEQVTNHAKSQVRAQGGLRTVWLIFDEWDYGLTFETPAPGAKFPHLEELRRESLFATQAYAPMNHTHASIPAYLLGRQLSEFCRRGDNEIEVLFPPLTQRVPMRELPTFVSAAAEAGRAVTVTGWYHPYCQFLPREKLKACDTTMYYEYGTPGLFLPRLASIAERLLSFQERMPAAHLNAYENLFAVAKMRVADPSADDVYVHLSVPHLPGIFDRRKLALVKDRPMKDVASQKDDYQSNLVLVDETVGALVRAMKESGVWGRTALVVTSDHPLHAWRWKQPENADRRVPFFIRMPNAKAENFSAPFNTVVSGAFLRELAKNPAIDAHELLKKLAKNSRPSTPEALDRCPQG